MAKSTFNKPPTKEEVRAQLDREVERFLSTGGTIDEVEPGATALEARSSPLREPLFTQPKSERTPLDHVAAELDARRNARVKRSSAKRHNKPRPRKQVIYDDFGEAVRTVWVEE